MKQKANLTLNEAGKLARRFFSLLCLLSISTVSWSHSADDTSHDGVAAKVRDADLIFYGQVVDVQYKNSEPTKEQPVGLPHTFVTYLVFEAIRGEVPDKYVTLRIPGGADGQGGVYLDSSSPAFALNQTDVLFVKGGDSEVCPLVECVEGRFRVHEDQVYNGWGVPVVEALKSLRLGGKPRFDLNVMEMPTPSFEVLMKRPEVRGYLEELSKKSGQSLAKLQKQYEAEAPKFTTVSLGNQMEPILKDVDEDPSGESLAVPMEEYGEPLTLSSFVEAVRYWSEKAGQPKTKFVSANIKDWFVVKDPVLSAMEVQVTEPVKVSDEERYDDFNKEEGQ